MPCFELGKPRVNASRFRRARSYPITIKKWALGVGDTRPDPESTENEMEAECYVQEG